MIEAVGLTRRFGATVAVDGLDFRVEPGEIVGFLGPNGAGKTTTMRMLTGTLPPSRGQALVAGLDVADASLAVRRKVGFMPEHVPLYTDQTVLGLLHYVAELKNVDRSTLANHLDDIMERVGLTDMAKRLVGHLSKGYRQRVGLAQALVGDPEVLILDDDSVTSVHAEITAQPGVIWFTDNRSSNGTKIRSVGETSDRLLPPRVPCQLKDGDIVQMGECILQFRAIDQAAVKSIWSR